MELRSHVLRCPSTAVGYRLTFSAVIAFPESGTREKA
jgi:hypothetical protein